MHACMRVLARQIVLKINSGAWETVANLLKGARAMHASIDMNLICHLHHVINYMSHLMSRTGRTWARAHTVAPPPAAVTVHRLCEF